MASGRCLSADSPGVYLFKDEAGKGMGNLRVAASRDSRSWWFPQSARKSSLGALFGRALAALVPEEGRVQHVTAIDSAYTPERVLALAASGELHSQHPLAAAVLPDAFVEKC